MKHRTGTEYIHAPCVTQKKKKTAMSPCVHTHMQAHTFPMPLESTATHQPGGGEFEFIQALYSKAVIVPHFLT